jgi:hypothetical protein
MCNEGDAQKFAALESSSGIQQEFRLNTEQTVDMGASPSKRQVILQVAFLSKFFSFLTPICPQVGRPGESRAKLRLATSVDGKSEGKSSRNHPPDDMADDGVAARYGPHICYQPQVRSVTKPPRHHVDA